MRAHVPSVLRASVLLALLVPLLAGCALLDALSDQGATRDAGGEVTESKVVPVATLREGDCLAFLPDTLAQVTAIPCVDPHTHQVIGQGEMSQAEGDAAGGLQKAVSVACAADFEVFAAAQKALGVESELKFLVANLERDNRTWIAYSCVATDSPVSAAN